MRPTHEADELDLPPLDGSSIIDGEHEDDAHGGDASSDIDDEAVADKGDAFDDATSEGDPLEDLAVEGAEAGWLVDAEDAGALDIGAFDVSLSESESVLGDDEPDAHPADDTGLSADLDEVAEPSAAHHTRNEEGSDGSRSLRVRRNDDGGEEGPLAEDEELREEDLPALDAAEDGDVAEDALFDHAAIGEDDELRWDDRAWTKTDAPPADAAALLDDIEDTGLLALAFDDPKRRARDATLRKLEESHRVMASTVLPGDSVVLALDGPERPMLVRILPDGVARIIAEIDVSAVEDDADATRVTALRWDAARGCLVVAGSFGLQAFRPA